MRSSRLLLTVVAALLLAAALPTASTASPAAGKGDKNECKERKDKKKQPKGGCSPTQDDEDDGHGDWERRWRFIDVELDGTTTARYAEDDKHYTIDGTMRYRMPKAGGYMDLRPSEALAPGLWSVKTGPLVVSTASRARYNDGDYSVNCSWTPPQSVMPKALAGAASIKRAGELTVQWSLAPTAQKCSEPVNAFWGTEPLPTEAMTTVHRLGDHFGATKVLHVDIDETIREPAGSLRVTWKGKITLKKAPSIGMTR